LRREQAAAEWSSADYLALDFPVAESTVVEAADSVRTRSCYVVGMVRAALSETVATALEELAARLRARWKSELVGVGVWLFGSHARGQAHESSDVDVLVVLERAGWHERREVLDLAADVGLEHDLDVSTTVFDRATWEIWGRQQRPLYRDVEREGVSL
jgi:predicted nucleotidyltransferase